MFDSYYDLRGKHATYVRFLSATTNRQDKEAKAAGVISTSIAIMTFAPLIGLAYNMKRELDNVSQDSYRIFAEAVIGHQKDLDFAYRLVMLAEKNDNLSSDDKINRAFREDENPEKLAANLELFYSYMRGGIEWLYEQFTDGATVKHEYLEKILTVVNLYKADFEL